MKILLAFCAVSLYATAAQAAPIVGVEPVITSVVRSQNFEVALVGRAFTQIVDGGGVDLQFDPSLVAVDGVTYDAAWEFFTSTPTIDNTAGVVRNIVFASFHGPTNNFNIAKIKLHSKTALGTSPLALAPIASQPFGSGGQPISVAFANGSARVQVIVPALPPPALALLFLLILGLSLGALSQSPARTKPRDLTVDPRFALTGLSSWLLPIAVALGLIGGPSQARAAADADSDSVQDLLDNCINAANPAQQDSNADGFGNACDADLNDDGFVNSLDLGLFAAVYNTSNADADLNSDGIVNALDLGLLHGLYMKPPGPTGVLLREDLTGDPPRASSAKYVALAQTLPDGSNVAAAYDMGGDDFGPTLALVLHRALALNDQAIPPDDQANDGVYSGYVKLNLSEIQTADQEFQAQLAAIPNALVNDYAGYDVVGQTMTMTSGLAAPNVSSKVAAQAAPAGAADTTFGLPNTFFSDARLPVSPDVIARSLMIRDTGVIADPDRTFDPCDTDEDGKLGKVDGAWSFATLMTNMANEAQTHISAQAFTHAWLRNWIDSQKVGLAGHEFTIPPKPGDPTTLADGIKLFIEGWNENDPSTLRMDRLPFRLLAIVNRADLAGGAYGQPPDFKKAETRFVFGLVDTKSPDCGHASAIRASQAMTVIFEYGDTPETCAESSGRAIKWLQLRSRVPGTPEFNDLLQIITDDVTLPGRAPLKNLNKSALNQLRTNELALGGPFWQLREFGLSSDGHLVSATTKQTPQPAKPDDPTMSLFRTNSAITQQYMTEFADDILCEAHLVPEEYPAASGKAFLGGVVDYGLNTFWFGLLSKPPIPGLFPSCWKTNVLASSTRQPTKLEEVRHKLSINTCDDCHSGETNTHFTHVDPLTMPSALSGFLTGIDVTDPTVSALKRRFNDLQRRGECMMDRIFGCGKAPIAAANQLCGSVFGVH